MFKVLVLIISTLDPKSYAVGTSIKIYPDMAACESEGKPITKKDAEKNFPMEMVGPVEIFMKCMTAEQADKAMEQERQRREPKA